MNKKSLTKVWDEVINELWQYFEENQQIYNDCIKTSKISRIKDENIYIVVSSIFAKSILTNDYRQIINDILSRKMNSNFQIHFLLENENTTIKNNKIENIFDRDNSYEDTNLIENYTFDNFIVGEFNKQSYTAVASFTKGKLGILYNPLVIYGSTGLGKTHLINALGNYFYKNFKDKKIIYVDTENFVREVFAAISKGSTFVESLKNKYVSYDLLLMDDIQYLSDKFKTCEVFFNIFNSMIKNNKQIVMTLDKPIESLEGFEERMISRFSSGLVLKINTPEIESLKKIALIKINESDDAFEYTEEAVLMVIKHFDNDLRKLIGIINRINFYAIQYLKINEIIDINFIQKFFDEEFVTFGNKQKHYNINPDLIIEIICKKYNSKASIIKSASRLKEVTIVRHICMYVLREKFQMSYSEIGKYFNNRDHSSVMSAIKRITTLIQKDEGLKKYIANLIK